MKLVNIKSIGRHENERTMQAGEIKIGRNKERSTDHIFFLRSGKRVFITDKEFYGQWKKID